MRLALIADVHGNLPALDAVLADLSSRNADAVLDLGDSLYGSLQPVETARRFLELGIPSVRGNQDRDSLADPGALPDGAIEWLRALPVTREWAGEILLCHGTPSSDTTYLLEHVDEHGVSLRRPEEIRSLLGADRHRVVACGHSHLPRTAMLPDGTLIVNPGSVGIPAYTDDRPFPHKMEAGSPHARYAMIEKQKIEKQKDTWRVEHIAVAYDWNAAARMAEANGRPDRAKWIATGRA